MKLMCVRCFSVKCNTSCLHNFLNVGIIAFRPVKTNVLLSESVCTVDSVWVAMH